MRLASSIACHSKTRLDSFQTRFRIAKAKLEDLSRAYTMPSDTPVQKVNREASGSRGTYFRALMTL